MDSPWYHISYGYDPSDGESWLSVNKYSSEPPTAEACFDLCLGGCNVSFDSIRDVPTTEIRDFLIRELESRMSRSGD